MDVISILKNVGAILPGSHFVGASGRHMDTYITKDALFPHVLEVEKVCRMFAEKNKDLDIDVVAAPALGGIILAQGTAYALSQIKGKEILAVFTEKTPDSDQIFTRGYDGYVKGRNVLVLEDLTTTGGSVQKVAASVKKVGGNVVAVSVMVNKNPKGVNSDLFGAPFNSLGELEVETYDEKDCPLCKNNIPINIKFGHGKKFLKSKN
ncbi:phosphoribosyltransferase [Candidatus Nomurabacteria bacterium]|nr:phosphoribosyltransferase [Candidatus Nomurabacteria bacterium]